MTDHRAFDDSTDPPPDELIAAEVVDESPHREGSPGTDVAGEIEIPGFDLVSKLGQHLTHMTFLAADQRLGRRCIVKVAASTSPPQEPHFHRLMEGARAIAALRTAPLATIFEVSHEPGPFFVRSYVQGKSFASLSHELGTSEKVKLLLQLIDELSELHQRGLAHGNLYPTNCFQHDGEIIVTDLAAPQTLEAAAGDIRAIGALISDWVLASPSDPDQSKDDRMCPVGPFDDDLRRIAFTAASYAGADSRFALSNIASQLRKLGFGNEGDKVGSSFKVARGVAVIGAGIVMILVAAVQALGYFAVLVLLGFGQVGPIAHMFMLTTAPPFIFGIALVRMGRNYLSSEVGDSSRSRRNSDKLESRHRESSSARPSIGSEETLSLADSGETVSAPSTAPRLLPPPTGNLRLQSTPDSIRLVYSPGSRLGLLGLVFILGLSFAVALFAVTETNLQSRAEMSFLVGGLISVVLVCVYCLCLVVALVMRPAANAKFAKGKPSLNRLMARLGMWNDTEKLVCDSDGVQFMQTRKTAGESFELAWGDIWDIKPGDTASGVELAANQQNVNFAVGASAEERRWIANTLNELRKSASGTAQSSADRRRIAEVPGRGVWQRLKSWFDFSRLPTDLALLGALGIVLFPLLEVIEIGCGLRSPSGFPADSVAIPLELGVNGSVIVLSITCTVLMLIGLRRLAELRKSGPSLIRAAFWSIVGFQLLLIALISVLRANGFETRDTATASVNIMTLANAIELAYGTAMITLLSIRIVALDLKRD